MEVDVSMIKKEVVIKSEIEDDSTVDDLIEDDNRNVITSSVKKELVSEIPLPSYPPLPKVVCSSPFEVHNSSTGRLPESSVKVNNPENRDPISLNFIPEAQNTVRKIIDPSLNKIKGRRRSRANKKSASQKIAKEKKQRNSDASICVENRAEQKLEKINESKSHREPDKTKPDSTVGIKDTPIQRPKKEFGSLLDEEKPKRKLRPKVFHCEQCPSTFSRMDYLKLHVMHHTNERPFKCDVCAKGFRMRWRVKLHRATHFEDKPHSCKFCSYRSIRRDALRSHAKRIHKSVID